MKFLISLLGFLLAFSLQAQKLILENEKFIFEKVDTVTSLSKKEIYYQARNWTVRNLKSSDSNIELNDTSSSQLSSTGNIVLEDVKLNGLCALTTVRLNFKFTVLVKDGRYKVIFDNMMLSNVTLCYQLDGSAPTRQYHEYPLEKLGLKKNRNQLVYSDIENKLTQLCVDLHQSMGNRTQVSDEEDDW